MRQFHRSHPSEHVGIEVLLYDHLKRGDAGLLEAEAAELGRFLTRAVTLDARPL